MADKRLGVVLSVYEASHRRRGTRIVHLIALPLMASGLLVATFSFRWAVAVVAVGWAALFVSHTFIEGNDQCLRNWRQALLAATWAYETWRSLLSRAAFWRRR